MTKDEVRGYVLECFPYSKVQPWLERMVKNIEHQADSDASITVGIKFDVEKFWDELTSVLNEN